MTDTAPWEWVEGDSIRSARFAMGVGLLLGAGTMLMAVAVLSLANLLRLPTMVANILVLGWLAVDLPFLYFVPRRHAVLPRVAISPQGLRLPLPLRTLTIPWRRVVAVGPDWVRVERYLGEERYRLTDRQAERLHRFLGYRSPSTLP